MEITCDFSNMFVPQISPDFGLSKSDVDGISGQLEKAHDSIVSMREEGELVFLDIPFRKEVITQINEAVEQRKNKFENFLTIAIGGSALGSIAVFNALSHPYYNLLDSNRRKQKPRMFFMDNVDPDRLNPLLDFLDLKSTLINIISKSGSTVETLANYLIIRDRLIKDIGNQSYKDNIIITTSETKGDLRDIARDEGISSLSIPDNLGGRFSVLSPAGLLSASIMGFDIEQFMAGARSMAKRTNGEDVWSNPAYLYSSAHYLADVDKKLDTFVIMPYSHSLRTIADWYAQLIAESLGKESDSGKQVGPTPVKTLGVTDQHSQLQLYVQGIRNKVITFIAVQNFKAKCKIPKAYEKYPSMNYLGGSSLANLFEAERKATEMSLTKNDRLNCTIYLPEINEYALGQLFYLFEVAVIHMGQLYGVNPLDQPGVEESKEYARGLMGREGYEDKKKEVELAYSKSRSHLL
jgi:glucose-6-phosphate isomerase